MVRMIQHFFYILLQCTWGLGQTALGFLFFLANIRCPHSFYRGCIETCWRSPYSGLSLGLFIFTPQAGDEYTSQVRVHEYGHTFQSLMLGPLYLLAVGLPSVIWAGLPALAVLRRERKISYYSVYPEKWASDLGARFAKETAVLPQK